MSTATTPTVEEIFAILHGCGDAGTFDGMGDQLARLARDVLPPLDAALVVKQVRATVADPGWRTAFAGDVLARLHGRPLAEVDEETLQRAMADAATAAIYELGEEIALAAGGA
jgi:hypothetical protein